MGVLLADLVTRRVPVSAFRRYRVSLQRKKCCHQMIGLAMSHSRRDVLETGEV